MPINLPKGVQFLELSPEKALEIWTHMNSIRGLFDDFRKDNFQLFFAGLTNPSSVWLERTDGNGVLYLTDVIRGLSATGHIVYWDRKLRGTEILTLECMNALMTQIPLQKINVYIPSHAAALSHYTKKLGFKSEGKIRKWSVMDGRTFDIFVHGITDSEAYDSLEKLREEKNGTVYEPVTGDKPDSGLGIRSDVEELSERTGDPTDGPTEHEHKSASGE